MPRRPPRSFARAARSAPRAPQRPVSARLRRRRKAREREMPRRVRIEIPASSVVRVLLVLFLATIAVRLWFPFLLFLVAVVLAVTLDPAVQWAERRISRGLAILGVALGIVATAAAVALWIAPPLVDQVTLLVRDFDTTREQIEKSSTSPLARTLAREVFELPHSPEVERWLSKPLVWGEVVFHIVAGAVLVVIVSLYLLADGKRMYAWLLSYVPRRHRAKMGRTVPAVTAVVRAYVRGQLLCSLLCGFFVLVLFTVLGVPAGLPLALLAAFLDVVPVLGTVVVMVLAVLLALTVSPVVAWIVGITYIAYHIFETYVLVPRVFGRRLRLSMLAVLLAFLVGGLLQGILGVVLVLPLVAAYPIVERIWLRKYLLPEVMRDHRALAISSRLGTDRAVERVIRGQPQRHELAKTLAGEGGEGGPRSAS